MEPEQAVASSVKKKAILNLSKSNSHSAQVLSSGADPDGSDLKNSIPMYLPLSLGISTSSVITSSSAEIPCLQESVCLQQPTQLLTGVSLSHSPTTLTLLSNVALSSESPRSSLALPQFSLSPSHPPPPRPPPIPQPPVVVTPSVSQRPPCLHPHVALPSTQAGAASSGAQPLFALVKTEPSIHVAAANGEPLPQGSVTSLVLSPSAAATLLANAGSSIPPSSSYPTPSATSAPQQLLPQTSTSASTSSFVVCCPTCGCTNYRPHHLQPEPCPSMQVEMLRIQDNNIGGGAIEDFQHNNLARTAAVLESEADLKAGSSMTVAVNGSPVQSDVDSVAKKKRAKRSRRNRFTPSTPRVKEVLQERSDAEWWLNGTSLVPKREAEEVPTEQVKNVTSTNGPRPSKYPMQELLPLGSTKCPFCPKTNRIRRQLKMHISRVHLKTARYPCPDCPEEFFTKAVMIRHRNKTHLGVSFACDQCDKIFYLKKFRDKHVETVHSGLDIMTRKLSQKVVIQCRSCPHISNSKAAAQNHERTHTDERPFMCEECGMGLKSAFSLKEHMACAHGVGAKEETCEICSKTLPTRRSLIRHVKDVHGETHDCPKCGKQFRRIQPFRQHLARHTGNEEEVKPHSCSTCGKRYAKPKTLQEHMHSHMGEKPYSCKIVDCEYRTNFKANVYKHMRTAHKVPVKGVRATSPALPVDPTTPAAAEHSKHTDLAPPSPTAQRHSMELVSVVDGMSLGSSSSSVVTYSPLTTTQLPSSKPSTSSVTPQQHSVASYTAPLSAMNFATMVLYGANAT